VYESDIVLMRLSPASRACRWVLPILGLRFAPPRALRCRLLRRLVEMADLNYQVLRPASILTQAKWRYLVVN
jgi:hypothetical protein